MLLKFALVVFTYNLLEKYEVLPGYLKIEMDNKFVIKFDVEEVTIEKLHKSYKLEIL